MEAKMQNHTPIVQKNETHHKHYLINLFKDYGYRKYKRIDRTVRDSNHPYY